MDFNDKDNVVLCNGIIDDNETYLKSSDKTLWVDITVGGKRIGFGESVLYYKADIEKHRHEFLTAKKFFTV